ncbi:MAG: DUF1559 domain-containing protein, partial [Thermoguttaceae bacterium]|nr:DUF1559 domain-containing protein [Thermoguttaceae bacterium]
MVNSKPGRNYSRVAGGGGGSVLRLSDSSCSIRAIGSGAKRAFTIVELLVVITIIGILMGILLPAIQQSRETGRRINCISNLKNQALGVVYFHEAYRHFPLGIYQATSLDHS